MLASTHNDVRTCRRLLGYARPYGLHILGIVLLGLSGPALALLYPLPLKLAVDSVIGTHPVPVFLTKVLPAAALGSETGVLITAACLLLGISLMSQLQRLANSMLCDYTGERLVLEWRSLVFGHVQRLSLSYHESKGTADSTYRLLRDASSIQDILLNGLIPLISACFMLAGLLYITARLDSTLVLVALGISPFLLFFSLLYRGRLRNQWRELKNVESSVMSIAHEVFGALRVVKAFAREDREQQRFVRKAGEGLRARMRLSWVQRQLGFLIALTIAVGQAAVLFIGMRHVRSGILTLGELLMVMAYLRRLYDPLRTGTQKVADLQASLVSAERVFTLLDQQTDVVERPNARPIERARGGVTFRDVSFGYVEGRPVVRGMSFEVRPGAHVCILGASGAGKTTLMNLLTRFYDPAAGAIFLDGVDLRDYKVADLRNQFAIVLQEPLLFSTSIAENIAYARSNATRQDVVHAARAANAHEFILSLPQGYDSRVGERGMSLSGGERQRIALARAFLKDAPILILDEPTSSVDVRSEAAIMEAMGRLMQNRTTLMIAHRPSTLGIFDLIVRIDDGQLVSVTQETRVDSLETAVLHASDTRD
jgi:ATP-binding cassette subfamily B protein